MKINTKTIIIAGIGLFAAILAPKLVEEVDAGEIVVIQHPVSGDISVYKEAGWVPQMFGKATHYRKENQFWFLSPEDKKRSNINNETDNSVPAIWNDGGKSNVSGSVRWAMPLDDNSIIALHANFGSEENIERQLVKTNVEKSVFLSGPMMSSKESYAEKRSDLIYLIEDQANKGVYRTKIVEHDIKDELTGESKKERSVEIVQHNGVSQRQEQSTVAKYNLKLYNVAINSIKYDKTVEDQIKVQQSSIMAVQTAKSNAIKAEQDAITAAKQGEAEATKAKWEIEVTKARQVTEAQARTAVATEAVKAAELNKQAMILEGQGEAEKKRLVMNADGALDKKLDAYIKVQMRYAEAIQNYNGSWVPQTIMGGGSGGSNAALNLMEMLSVKAARDLSLDLKTK